MHSHNQFRGGRGRLCIALDAGPALSCNHVSFKCGRHQLQLQVPSRFALVFSFWCLMGPATLRCVYLGPGNIGGELFCLHLVSDCGLSPLFFPQSFSDIALRSILHGILRVLPITGRPSRLECGASPSPPIFRRERRPPFAGTRILPSAHGLAAEFKNLRSRI